MNISATILPEFDQEMKNTRRTLEREYSEAGLRMVSWHTDRDGLFALSVAARDGAGAA